MVTKIVAMKKYLPLFFVLLFVNSFSLFGYRSVDYSRLTPVLVETIKAQQKQITTISQRLSELEKLLNK